MLWTLLGLVIGFALIGNYITPLVKQLMDQLSSTLEGAGGSITSVVTPPAPVAEEEPAEEEEEPEGEDEEEYEEPMEA